MDASEAQVVLRRGIVVITFLCSLGLLAASCGNDSDPPPFTPGTECPSRVSTRSATWLHPLPQGNYLEDLAYVGNRTYFAVTRGGTALESSGSGWRLHEVTWDQLLCVWGTSPSSVYAAGEDGAVYAYDGSTWRLMARPITGDIVDISGTSPENIWIAGLFGVARFDGRRWSRVKRDSGSEIRQLCVLRPDLAYGCGEGSIWASDGETWTRIQSSPGLTFTGIWAPREGTLYATSEQGKVVALEHGSWHETDLGTYLYSIDGSGPDDVWVAGNGGRYFHKIEDTWFPVTDPLLSYAYQIAVGGVGDAVAGGAVGKIVRLSAGGWSEESEGVFGPTPASLVRYRGVVTGFGGSGYLTIQGDQIEATNTFEFGNVHAAWASKESDLVVMVGHAGRIVHLSGSGVSVIPPLTGRDLLQVDGISDDDIWAVGDSGTVLHFDGGTWSQVDCPFHRTIRDVWAAGPDDVYAITMDWPSEESSLIHFDGARWTTLEELDGASCLWAHSPDEIYMATRDGRVLVRRLGHIEELVDGCGTYLGINGSPSGYVVAVGWGGIVRIGHGKVDFFKCSATQPLYDAYVEEDGSAIVAGAFSAVLRIPAG